MPGVVYGILVNATNMQRIATVYMNNSQLVFNDISPGKYIVYVYYHPNSTIFNYTEYWGNLTIDVPEHLVYNFTRDMPWVMNVTSTFNTSNDSFSIIVYINNNNTQEKNLTGKVTVYISNTESVSDASILSRSVNLSPGINPIAFNYMPTQQGTYYIYVVLNVTILQPLGQSIVTDQHGWERIMAVYTVSFVESGLPLGTSWSIKLNGTIINATSNTITLFLPENTYEYYIEPIHGYVANITSNTITVNGPVIIPIHFRRVPFILSGVIAIIIVVALIVVAATIMALWLRSRNAYDDVATA
ncbi:hypothetical protein [Vulcanisaeta sp. JCM 14467]|uniref:hypothetical protein n=1 Tax=Vulcanisaeta sp. JCM 14467 TaxID=1295370 RepID=UPI0006CFA563|nr:hypothetical protein [Vulcanisaeta sp. JCM 14467]